MAHTWKAIKDREQFNKGRAALRGDYLQGSYNTCPIANFGPHYKHCAAIFEKAEARANRPLSERGYRTIAKVLNKRDKKNKQQHHFVPATPKVSLREKREKKFGYVTQA
jgi:hypothetical protein